MWWRLRPPHLFVVLCGACWADTPPAEERWPILSWQPDAGRNGDLVLSPRPLPANGMVAVLPGDVVAVAEPWEYRVLIMTDGGAALGSKGRAGMGPGEFRGIGRIGTHGNNLWVWDPLLRRMTIVTSSGVEKAIAVPTILRLADASEEPWRVIQVLATTGAESYLAQVASGEDTGIAEVSFTGHPNRLVLQLPRGPASLPLLAGGFGLNGDLFGANPHFATSPGGKVLGVVSTEFTGPRRGMVTVATYSADGEPMPEWRAQMSTARMRRGALDSVLQPYLRRLPLAIGAELRVQAYVPSFVPPVTGVVIGEDGSVWVGIRQPKGSPPRFLLIEPTGVVAGLVTLPCDSKLILVGPSRAFIARSGGGEGVWLGWLTNQPTPPLPTGPVSCPGLDSEAHARLPG